MKTAYICGPLTELLSDPWGILRIMRWMINFLPWLLFGRRLVHFWTAQEAKAFYVKVADHIERLEGNRPFVPHEHYDPIRHAHFTPVQVDEAERNQVCNKTWLLVVVAVAPSWGGGIEVEWAHQNNIRVVILWQDGMKLSRLLRGNPAIDKVLNYAMEEEALEKLSEYFESVLFRKIANVLA